MTDSALNSQQQLATRNSTTCNGCTTRTGTRHQIFLAAFIEYSKWGVDEMFLFHRQRPTIYLSSIAYRLCQPYMVETIKNKKSTVMETSTSKSVSSSTRTNATTTTSTRPLSVDELTDVRDTLKGPTPLTDRSVLIPFGGKAFLPGRLAPILSTHHNNDESCPSIAARTSTIRASDDWKEQETVVVHDVNLDFMEGRRSNNEAETSQRSHVMTRQEALDYLQKEIDSLQKKPSNRTTQTTASTNRREREDPTKRSALNIENDTTLPFIEIREELDETGQVMKTQAVNVTHHLQYLSQPQQHDTPPPPQQQATKRESTTSDNHITPVTIDSIPSGGTSDDATNTIDKAHIDSYAEATVSPPVRTEFSNEHYETIFQRLDELMLLEENPGTVHTHSSIATAPTTTRTTKHKGWAKGFLNRPTTKTKSSPAIIHQQTPLPIMPLNSSTKHSVVVTPTLSSSLAAAAAASSSVLNDSNDTIQTKKVSFTGQDDVQMIPRIGQRSIASEQTPRLVIPPNTHRNTTDVPFSSSVSSSSSSIDSSAAVASQVMEKKTPSTRRRRKQPPPSFAATTAIDGSIGRDDDEKDDDSNHSPINHTPPMTSTTDTTTASTKKLSRFAQERRQYTNHGDNL